MEMALRSLRAVNCGPLRDVCINFCDAEDKPRPITMLAGANSSGKTTILELIMANAFLLMPEEDLEPAYLSSSWYRKLIALNQPTNSKYYCVEMSIENQKVYVASREFKRGEFLKDKDYDSNPSCYLCR